MPDQAHVVILGVGFCGFGALKSLSNANVRITERTVKAHRGSAMAKMGLKSAAELIKMILIIELNGKETEVQRAKQYEP